MHADKAGSKRKVVSLCDRFLVYSDRSSRTKIVCTAFGWRLGIWLAMSISCAMLPNHNPGNDVIQFQLKDPKVSIDEHTSKRFIELETCRLPLSSNEQSLSGQSIHRSVLFPTFLLQDKIYPFLLQPLTRWDAARFLRLAYNPDLRRPTFMDECNENDTNVCPLNRFSASEQAHAFLPLFPIMIRVAATILTYLIPRFLLPASCMSLYVLAAICLNIMCFLLVTLDLYDMTKNILLFHCKIQGRCKDESNPVISSRDCEIGACRVTMLFVCNPANVFFGTAYSEAMCAALLCRGCRWALDMVLEKADSDQNIIARPMWLLVLGSTGCWWLAAITRSNGTLYGGFLLLYGAGLFFRKRLGSWVWPTRICVVCYILLMVVFLAYGSIGWHNFRGYSFHCVERTGTPPAWCEKGPWFNLYGHVQRKYWNVGFLRYFQLKQIPNFLLASPILVLSAIATTTWIQMSWKLLSDNTKSTLDRFISWVVAALQKFAGEPSRSTPVWTPSEVLLGSPYLLGFYAVLAASTLLGFTIAHVQISTRLICSSCPALYWFLAGALTKYGKRFGDALIGYFLLFTILGIIMYPNWLPWT